jgi:hypothetical protein
VAREMKRASWDMTETVNYERNENDHEDVQLKHGQGLALVESYKHRKSWHINNIKTESNI